MHSSHTHFPFACFLEPHRNKQADQRASTEHPKWTHSQWQLPLSHPTMSLNDCCWQNAVLAYVLSAICSSQLWVTRGIDDGWDPADTIVLAVARTEALTKRMRHPAPSATQTLQRTHRNTRAGKQNFWFGRSFFSRVLHSRLLLLLFPTSLHPHSSNCISVCSLH